MVNDIELQRMWVLQSPLNFTRYFFKESGGKRFIVAHHHKTVCDALDCTTGVVERFGTASSLPVTDEEEQAIEDEIY